MNEDLIHVHTVEQRIAGKAAAYESKPTAALLDSLRQETHACEECIDICLRRLNAIGDSPRPGRDFLLLQLSTMYRMLGALHLYYLDDHIAAKPFLESARDIAKDLVERAQVGSKELTLSLQCLGQIAEETDDTPP